MYKILRIPREKLFLCPEGNKFPKIITLLVDSANYEADIDIVITTCNQPQAANLVIENYLALEKKTRIHIWVIETSRNFISFLRTKKNPNISRVCIFGNIHAIKCKYENKFWISNAVGFAAQLGSYLGSAPHLFLSHVDMMGCKENFLSFILSKLDGNRPLASFTQRGVLPFTGGMVYRKDYFSDKGVDWLPRNENPFQTNGIENLKELIEALNWIDAGEQLVFEALSHGERGHVCASRGITGDFFGQELKRYKFSNEEAVNAGLSVDYASLVLSREEFIDKYPSLAKEEIGMWRKCFDDSGELVFIHRGRGTVQGKSYDTRGDFISYLKEFNKKFKK